MSTQKRGEQMFKVKIENVEIYFICYKKEEMELVEFYYDEILDINYWYFNAYLAYKYWLKNFKDLKAGKLTKQLLIVAANHYLIYMIENKKYKNKKERKKLTKDLKKIEKELNYIINDDQILAKL